MKNIIYNRNDEGNWVATSSNSQQGEFYTQYLPWQNEGTETKNTRLSILRSRIIWLPFSLICSSTDFYVLIFQILRQYFCGCVNHCFVSYKWCRLLGIALLPYENNQTNLYLSQAHAHNLIKQPLSLCPMEIYIHRNWELRESQPNQSESIPYTQ